MSTQPIRVHYRIMSKWMPTQAAGEQIMPGLGVVYKAFVCKRLVTCILRLFMVALVNIVDRNPDCSTI